MTVSYLAENWLDFSYAYIDQDGGPIDVSTATSIILYLYLPNKVRTVVGTYSETNDKNLVLATAKTIINSDLANSPVSGLKTVLWQFKVVLANGKVEWSPRQSIQMQTNLG